MAQPPFKIDPHLLPNEGQPLTGTQPASFFELAANDPIQCTSPLTYDLNVLRDEDTIIITGHLSAEFEFECGRCLGRFRYLADSPEYKGEMTIETIGEIMDLTDSIREDILLSLPSYPRCEDGNVLLRECPAQGRFDAASDSASGSTASQDAGVWDVLDQFKKS